MKQLFRMMLALTCILFGVGCDQQGRPIQEFGLEKLAKGVSSESDVRMVMGQPGTVWDEQDGGRTLEYPKGPEGSTTWMFYIGKDGKLRDYKQVLTQETFGKIRPGMTRDEVRRMLGQPKSVMQFRLKNEEVWDWRYLEVTQRTRFFSVHFDMGTGKVTGTSSQDDPRNTG